MLKVANSQNAWILSHCPSYMTSVIPKNNKYAFMQIVLCKFHTVMLTSGGRVLTCGHGLGGRLGHNSEQSVVVSRDD